MKSLECFALSSLCLATALGCTATESAPGPGSVEQTTAPEASPSPEEELEQIHARLEAVKARLFDEGAYNCCVEPSCDWCALHEGSCDCFTNLQAGGEVCPGCGLGWHNGQGIAEGVDPDDVQWNITHEHSSDAHEH